MNAKLLLVCLAGFVGANLCGFESAILKYFAKMGKIDEVNAIFATAKTDKEKETAQALFEKNAPQAMKTTKLQAPTGGLTAAELPKAFAKTDAKLGEKANALFDKDDMKTAWGTKVVMKMDPTEKQAFINAVTEATKVK